MKTHKSYMERAIGLAKKACGKTFPNPLVGAVIVKNGKIIAEGYHKKAGHAHAEAEALKKAGKMAKNASLYVTLEPCAHFGKTPPCANSIIKNRIKKVYIAMKDPNPLVNGKGVDLLRKSGIPVKIGVCRNEAKALNGDYIKRMRDVHRNS